MCNQSQENTPNQPQQATTMPNYYRQPYCSHNTNAQQSTSHLLNDQSTIFTRHKKQAAHQSFPNRRPPHRTHARFFVMPFISSKRSYYLTCCLFILTACSLLIGHVSCEPFEPASEDDGSSGGGDSVQPPQQYHQHNNIYQFFVDENSSPGTRLGTIRSSDNQVPSLITVQPLANEIEFNRAFRVNFTTGDLITAGVLDRELREEYRFIAIVSNPFAEVKCTITVRDVNDNAPFFLTNASETTHVIEVPEGPPEPGKCHRRVLPLAVDLDSFSSGERTFGIREFRIISGNTPVELFRLVEHDAACNTSSTSSQNSQPDSTSARMAAAAAAENPQLVQQLRQQATVLIPSQPMVQSLPGLISAAPSAFSGMSALLQQQVASASSKYLIDIEVSQPLDRENQSSYQLVVEVSDGAEPFNVGRLSVTVNVLDMNDNDPIFTKPLYECHISENTQKGTILPVKVTAHDIDLDQNGRVSYSIKRHTTQSSHQLQQQNGSSNNEYSNDIASSKYGSTKQRSGAATQQQAGGQKSLSGMQRAEPMSDSLTSTAMQDPYFKISPSTGEITLVSQLDYETDQWHELTIEARDQGRPSRSSTTIVRVNVVDVPHDDPPASSVSRMGDGRSGQQASSSGLGFGSDSTDGSRGPLSSARLTNDNQLDAHQPGAGNQFNLLQQLNLNGWFAQMNSSALFIVVLVALLAITFPVCLVKIKSRQPESDYNDTAGLTNQHGGSSSGGGNGQAKPSPSHSTSNMDHPDGMLTANGSLQHGHSHRHEHHSSRGQSSHALGAVPFAGLRVPVGKMRSHGGGGHHLQYNDSSSNHYHNPYPSGQRPRHHSSTSGHHLLPESPADHHHQMPLPGMGGSRGGTMTLSHSNHLSQHQRHLFNHTPPGHHHSFEHHGGGGGGGHHHGGHHQPVQFAGANLATGSLTYDHSHAAMLHVAQHHQSLHQLSPLHQVMAPNHHHNHHAHHPHHPHHMSKGGTMNTIGTHHSDQHRASSSPMAATPNTTHSSAVGVALPSSSGMVMPHHPGDPSGLLQTTTTAAAGRRNPLLPSIPQGASSHHSSCLGQEPVTPTHPHLPAAHASMFPWDMPVAGLPPGAVVQGPGSTMGCYPGGHGDTPGSTVDSCSSPSGQLDTPQPLDRWLDPTGAPGPAQLLNSQDWCGTYDWDYLEDWQPEYHNLMPLIEAEAEAASAAAAAVAAASATSAAATATTTSTSSAPSSAPVSVSATSAISSIS